MRTSLLFFTLAATQLFAQVPQSGLIAYFPFSGNALNQSGNNVSSTVFGANHTFDRFNNPNSAYYFDGNSYIQFIANNLQNDEYTYSLWANISEIPDFGTMAFALNIGSTGGDQSINISNGYFNGQKTFNGWLGGGYNKNALGFALQENNTLETDKWTHVVCTRFPSYTLLYIDGIVVDSIGADSIILPSYGTGSVKGYIGIRNSMLSGFTGTIDDVAIYNRALSKSEVSDLYFDNSTGLVQLQNNPESLFELYPNPSANNIIHITGLQKSTKVESVKLLSCNGTIQELQEIYSEKSETLTYQYHSKSGIYTIIIQTSDGNLVYKKLIVQ